MAKRNDYITGREDGLLMALEIVKNEGVEALEKEIKFRNVTGIRTALAKKDINRATIKIKEQTVDTVTILSVATLHDEFGFGTQRCDRFIKRFNKKAEFLPLLYLNVRIAKKKMNMIIQNSVIYVDTRQIGIMKY